MKITYGAYILKPEYQILGEGLTEDEANELMRQFFSDRPNIIKLNTAQWGDSDALRGSKVDGLVKIDRASERRKEQMREIERVAKNAIFDAAVHWKLDELETDAFVALVTRKIQVVLDARKKADKAYAETRFSSR